MLLEGNWKTLAAEGECCCYHSRVVSSEGVTTFRQDSAWQPKQTFEFIINLLHNSSSPNRTEPRKTRTELHLPSPDEDFKEKKISASLSPKEAKPILRFLLLLPGR